MSIQLPSKPWNEGDTFTNDSTGVEYTYDGVKWLASGGGEADEATLDFINEVDRTSQMRDEAIEQQHKQDETLNTAAHLRMEQQIVRIGTWSQSDDDKVRQEFAEADAALQSQIDAIDNPDGKYLPLSGGEMTGPAVLKVNHLEPVNTPMIQYNGDPNSTHAAGLISRYMMTKYVAEEIGKIPQPTNNAPMSGNIMAYFQMWKDIKLDEGCFNMLSEQGVLVNKAKDAKFVTFHILEGFTDCEWMQYDLNGKGQIHITGEDGKVHLSAFVIGAEKRDGQTGGVDPTDAIWSFELSEYSFGDDWAFVGNCFLQMDGCLTPKT